MPTLLRFRNFRIVIYRRDHIPAHVHALGPGVEVIFNLGCWTGPVTVRENLGVANAIVNELSDLVAAQLHLLCEAWENIHGDPTRV